ncbi:3-oxoacyl-ACP reductase FabG [Xanthobacter sp. DSM 24535]|uniref:3-oxoacyl-ACP reductase FabG n=1 Tax=Roseixanthobacter psychrophilus TaxID=3119917 RepID=UPI00372A9806
MEPRQAGRVALVTGSARGIGYATAERFAEDGASVVICDLDGAAANAAADRIAHQYGVGALGLACNVGDPDAVEAMGRTIVERFGSLDILVNNAGVTRDNLIHKMSVKDWDDIVFVHLRGSFLCAQMAQKEMVKRQWGRIVNLSSTSALGNRGQVNYSTAKAGLQGMTRSLALELGRFGITVNCVAPGFIDTEMTRLTAERLGKDPEDYKAERAKGIAVGRVGVPRDVANLVCFLASAEASFVSGQVIYVSGGPETRRGG